MNKKIVMVSCDECQKHYYVDSKEAEENKPKCLFCGKTETAFYAYSFYIEPTMEETNVE